MSKKNNIYIFLKFFCLTLSIIYVIPLYNFLNKNGKIFISFAYVFILFIVFMSILGIFLPISKITKEYNLLEFNNIKKYSFSLLKRIIVIFSFLIFLFIEMLAPFLSSIILGNGNYIKYVNSLSFIIRLTGFSLFFVPLLNFYRGYYYGHKYFNQIIFSVLLEQIINFLIIVFSSYICIKIFHFNNYTFLGICLIGFCIGSFISYAFLKINIKKLSRFKVNIPNRKEPLVDKLKIIKHFSYISFTFILIAIFLTSYDFIDLFTGSKYLINLTNYNSIDSYTILSIILMWTKIFNLIFVFFVLYVFNKNMNIISEYFYNKDNKNLELKINKLLSYLFNFFLPISVCISFLSRPIWNIFYGYSKFGSSILSLNIFTGITLSICIFLLMLNITLKNSKNNFFNICVGLFFKIILQSFLIDVFYKIGFPAFHGIITSSLIGYFLTAILCFKDLIKKFKLNFEETVKSFMNSFSYTFLMLIVLFICSFFISINRSGKFYNILIVSFYLFIAFISYLSFLYFSKYYFNKNKKQ